MPKPTVILPDRPEVLYGIFDRYGNPVTTPPPTYDRGAFAVGYKIHPSFGVFRGSDVRATAEDWDEHSLARVMSQWNMVCSDAKRQTLTMKDVLVGQQFQSVSIEGGWYLRFRFENGEVITFRPTRGYSGPTITDCPQGPFTIARVMASEKIFVLDTGARFSINKKVRLDTYSISDRLIAEIFAE